MLLHKALLRSCQEVFSWDSKLVQRVREDYYRVNCPCFNSKTSCNMVDVFQSMIKSAGLLSSKIYEIKEAWTRWSKLPYANYALRTLPKGLPSVPFRVPKVHGPNWYPPSRCPPSIQQGNPLSMVWEGRAE